MLKLVDEAMKAAGRPHYQFSQQWDAGSMAQADVIFTEMVAGEWYLCQDLFQHAPEQYTLFIFPDNEHATVDEVYRIVCSMRYLCRLTLAFSG
ncbi:2-component transcriptional regulator [Klebsiella pneumoniae]|uniref:2-component transcriptional regulator n=1 Tax=Klebsiella pneumoniae TaxID=573 RepID=A0A378BAT9_KLEPN|nr:2-component transcriptional regulator [Klebsiella pneumoniae]